jgi:ligand-binding sensor domain-containing protein/serine phosphatase RsbU (regulator of sigma subunit)
MRFAVLKYSLLLLLALNYAKAQFAPFNHLTTDQGLSNNSISSIIQDPKGFIWIGTYDGLNKYDGYKITTYMGNDTGNYLRTGRIRFLHADKENNLWIAGADKGLTKLDLLTNKMSYYLYDSTSKNCITSNFVSDIKEFEDGILYIATSHGVSILNKKTDTFTSLKHSDKDQNSLLVDQTNCISKDNNGHIWFGHSGFGITEYIPSQNKFIRYSMSDTKIKLKGNRIKSIFSDSKGLVWISMWHAGIGIYNTKTGKYWHNTDTNTTEFKGLLQVGLISDFTEDENGDIWMCAAEKGIIHYNRAISKTTCFLNDLNDPQSISDNTNLCIMRDRTGLIWSGTWKGGVNYFNPNCLKFGLIKHQANKVSTLNDNDVISIKQNTDREVIIGTGKNICLFDPLTSEFKKIKFNSSVLDGLVDNSQVNFTIKHRDGTFWYSTNGAGVYHYFPKTNKYVIYGPYSGKQHYLHESPVHMLLDKDNNLWVSAWGGGLYLYDPTSDSFLNFLNDPNDKEFFSPIVLNAVQDGDGRIWVGTQKLGLLLMDPIKRTFKKTSIGNSKELSIMCSMLDAKDKNKLWLGCGGHLIEFNTKDQSYIDHTEKNPGLNSGFLGMVTDNAGHIWISSDKDLYRYDPAVKNYTLYTSADGTQGKEYNYNAITKLSNNKLLIGGTNGLNYFDPKDIHEKIIPPAIEFTDLLVLNKPRFFKEEIGYLKEIELSYKEYFFSISFAALDYLNSSKNKFMYKMDGLDKDWINIGEQHQLTFTNLDPGDYVLNIKAANSKGVWNQTPLKLKIIITPPFWRTNWFYALCLIVIIGSVYSYIKYREKKLTKEKEILEKKVDERTHELNEEKLKVEEAHKDIKDSIYYAQKIQSAIIPTEEDFKKVLPNSFVLFQPKDIVSGDFYWLVEKSEYVFCAIADCTGHGVPGGFMTMLGSGFLNEIVNEQQVNEPAEILNKLREKIISTLKQTGKSGENKDGMDIVLLRFNKKNRELAYATANNGFILLDGETMTEHYGDKQPVGIYGHEIKPFTAHSMILKENVTIYSYTDGYPDQFGGEKGKKFKYRALNELLIKNAHLQMQFQKDKLHEAFAAWKGELEQIDDVCVVGIKF